MEKTRIVELTEKEYAVVREALLKSQWPGHMVVQGAEIVRKFSVTE